MSISPFQARPVAPGDQRRRDRLVILLTILGISASLLAFAVSPSVRHAVGHAAHSVKGAVGHVLDRDAKAKPKPASSTTVGRSGGSAAPVPTGAHSSTSAAPAP